MRRFSPALMVAVIVLFVALSGTASAARASNSPSSVFDAVASEVAGKPVSVWYENSWDDWVGVGLGDANGFTYLDEPVVYLSPRQCETLWALQSGESVGTYHAASALLTLVHEAIHQRGVTDEGETDCLALPLLPGIAVGHFGVPETVAQSYTVTTSRFVRVSKTKRIRVTSKKVAVRQIENTWLAKLAEDAHRWHVTKGAEYQGGC